VKKKDQDHDCACGGGLTRRGFIATVGAGAAAVAVSGRVAVAATADKGVMTAEEMAKVTLRINGQAYRLLVEPRWPLLFVLRERLGLTATKVGCERGECGACTVLIDGVPRYACLTLAVEADGREITTMEGLMRGEELGPTQQAFLEEDGYQCGYCTPGQIMAAEGLLRANPNPAPEEIAHGMSGNLCRCGAYPNIAAAVRRAAQLRRKERGEP
jgi:xanthine dehydrogenase YagT iron-sulfur-binding subunit